MREHVQTGGYPGTRLLWLAIAAVVVITSSLYMASPGEAEDVHQLRLGIAVHGGDASLVSAREAAIGRQFDVVRVFKTWDDPFPTADDLELLDGRDIILSIKPTRGSVYLKWADIAAAQPGDPLYAKMVSWGERLAPYESQVGITFHHEPEAHSNVPHGTDDEFIAAWQRFMEVTTEAGLDATRVWIMTDYSFSRPPSDRRQAIKWYPGDEWVDAIAADAYNWHHCRTGITTSWQTLAEIIEPMRQFGLAHPNERLMLTEIGSVEDRSSPGRKAGFIADMQDLFAQPGYERFDTLSWFDLYRPNETFDCDWRVDTSNSALDAFATLAADPLYGGSDGVPTTTTTTSPPPTSGCTVVFEGSSATLTWAPTGGTDIVRRNGSWLTTAPPGSTSYVDDPAPPDATYLIRTWVSGVISDVDCIAPMDTTTTTTTTTTTSTTTTIPTSTTTTTTTTTTIPDPGSGIAPAVVEPRARRGQSQVVPAP